MADGPAGGGSFPEDRYTNPETALGGADAVEKTTYVTGEGTEPETPSGRGASVPKVTSKTGEGTTWMIVAFLLAAAVLVYLLGFGR